MARAQVRLLQRMAGPLGNWGPGRVIAVPAAEAKALVDGGFAEYVDLPLPQPPPAETATLEPPERAVKAPARKRAPRRKKVSGGTT